MSALDLSVEVLRRLQSSWNQNFVEKFELAALPKVIGDYHVRSHVLRAPRLVQRNVSHSRSKTKRIPRSRHGCSSQEK